MSLNEPPSKPPPANGFWRARPPNSPSPRSKGGPLLGIAEHIVGFVDLLEARLRLRVVGVAVGVVLRASLR
jgi:hypothetical protein